ncbi:hypothetical protein ElyMa_002124000 [Elysia marginata]|uniref:Uncharacterized protein n=1 Tax=Elysia marginata TaxID=1093978 RepID=A0AAV4FHW2_9GAST|nr:hypothetical protein ElyMa_002124000 [Elysia marginata]
MVWLSLEHSNLYKKGGEGVALYGSDIHSQAKLKISCPKSLLRHQRVRLFYFSALLGWIRPGRSRFAALTTPSVVMPYLQVTCVVETFSLVPKALRNFLKRQLWTLVIIFSAHPKFVSGEIVVKG